MQLQYAKFTQGHGETAALPEMSTRPALTGASVTEMMASAAAARRSTPAESRLPEGPTPLDPFVGDKIALVAKAALAAQKQGEAKTAVTRARSPSERRPP